MFQRILTFLKEVVAKMFPKNDMSKAFDIDIPVSDEMSSAIDLWTDMYKNEAYWLDENTKSLNLAKAIASELARLTTIEFSSAITKKDSTADKPSSNEAIEALNEDYKKQVIDKIKIQTEYACAKGGLMMKPYLDGDRIAVDFAQADLFYPIRYASNGDILSCIFTERIHFGDKTYTRLEYHNITGDVYSISNRAYVSAKGSDTIGNEIPLDKVDEWAELVPDAQFKGIDKPLFSYFKMPLANAVDTESPLGVSVYADAVDLIREADRQYSRTLWEYEGGELAVDAAIDLFRIDADTQKAELPKGKERLYRTNDLDVRDQGLDKAMTTFAPNLRDESYWKGLNKILQRIEFQCGLAYGTLSDVQMVDKTAEEIRSSKQRSYATVADIQTNLQNALEHLVWAMQAWKAIDNTIKVNTEAKRDRKVQRLDTITVPDDLEVSFDWDDSLVVDSKTEQAIMMSEVAAGLIKPEYYLKKRYGMTDEQIKEVLPGMDNSDPPDDKLE